MKVRNSNSDLQPKKKRIISVWLLIRVLTSEDIEHSDSVGFRSGFSRKGVFMKMKSESLSNMIFCVLCGRCWVGVDAFDMKYKSFCTNLSLQIFLFTN